MVSKFFVKTWFSLKGEPDLDTAIEVHSDDPLGYTKELVDFCKRHNETFVAVYWRYENETEWRVSNG